MQNFSTTSLGSDLNLWQKFGAAESSEINPKSFAGEDLFGTFQDTSD